MPYYLHITNDLITKKNELLVIRVFNNEQEDQVFFVGIHLFHGLFIPYLEILSDKVWIEMT